MPSTSPTPSKEDNITIITDTLVTRSEVVGVEPNRRALPEKQAKPN